MLKWVWPVITLGFGSGDQPDKKVAPEIVVVVKQEGVATTIGETMGAIEPAAQARVYDTEVWDHMDASEVQGGAGTVAQRGIAENVEHLARANVAVPALTLAQRHVARVIAKRDKQTRKERSLERALAWQADQAKRAQVAQDIKEARNAVTFRANQRKPW